MSRLLASLLALSNPFTAYFTLGSEVDPAPGVDPPTKEDPPDDGVDPPEDNPDDGGHEDEPDPEEPTAKELRETKAKLERIEREAAENRAALERERASRAAPPQKSQEQAIFEQEEARLRDPNITEQERWTIGANREIRASARLAAEASSNTRDMQDMTAYDQLAMKDTAGGKYAKLYKDRVEKKAAEVRATGGFLPRKFILQMLIGEDRVEGRVETKKAAPKDNPNPGVKRGKPASPRGDVTGRSTPSEREARRKRLEGQYI